MPEDNTTQLTRVTIRGFKSIAYDRPVELLLGKVNLLLGANGAGKSTIVSFFKMLEYMMSASLQRYINENGKSQIFLHYGTKRTPTIGAELYFEGNGFYDIYEFNLTNAVPDRLIVNYEKVEWKKEGKENAYEQTITSTFDEIGLIKEKETNRVCKILYWYLSQIKVYQFSDSLPTSPMRQASTVESAHYLQSQANNLASFLFYLRNNYPKQYERIVLYVKRVVPQFREFYLEPDQGYISLRWRDTSLNDYVLIANQFSDGAIRFIALATLFLQPKETMPPIIIVDEPELGLHPYAIDQLAEMVEEASEKAQIILATQSPILLDRFDVVNVTIVERDEEAQCTLVKKLDEKALKEWLEEYTLSELWEKNVIGGRPL